MVVHAAYQSVCDSFSPYRLPSGKGDPGSRRERSPKPEGGDPESSRLPGHGRVSLSRPSPLCAYRKAAFFDPKLGILSYMPIRLTQEDTIYSVERCPIFPPVTEVVVAHGKVPHHVPAACRKHTPEGRDGRRQSRTTTCSGYLS